MFNLLIAIAIIGGLIWLFYEPKKKPEQAQDQSHDNPPNDTSEPSFYEAAVQRRVAFPLRLTYRDAAGSITKRDVDVQVFEPSSPQGLFSGFCRTRQDRRTFRFDRVVTAIDRSTGEVLPKLQAHLQSLWEQSPDRTLDVLFSDHLDQLKVLLYVAKADGQMRANEVAVIGQHLRALTGDDRLQDDNVRELLGSIGQPTMAGFKQAFGRVRNANRDQAILLARACTDIVATQKTAHPNETAALDYLANALNKGEATSD